MKKLFIIEYGIKRSAEELRCEHCNKKFIRRIGLKTRFCSIACFNSTRLCKQDVRCSNCNSIFKIRPSRIKKSKHGYFFCSRKCKDFAQSLAGKVSDIRPSHYGKGNGSWAVKRFFKKEKENGCSCGEKRIYLLVVHHKDGNRENNAFKNLEIVCGNCHIKRHLKLVNGLWIYDTKVLTPKEIFDNL